MRPLLVSLSTIPPRFKALAPVLQALRSQLHAGDRLSVFVPQTYRRFGPLGEIPPELESLATFERVAEDLGPATKILPAAQQEAGQDTLLVYCDDDRVPEAGWLDALRKEAETHPDKVIVSSGLQLTQFLPDHIPTRQPRARLARKYAGPYLRQRLSHLLRQALSGRSRIRPARALYSQSGYVDLAQGLGGVAVRPHFFDADFYQIPDLAFPVDDIWLSANFERRGIGIWASSQVKVPRELPSSNESALVDSAFAGLARAQSDLAVIQLAQKDFGIWGGAT